MPHPMGSGGGEFVDGGTRRFRQVGDEWREVTEARAATAVRRAAGVPDPAVDELARELADERTLHEQKIAELDRVRAEVARVRAVALEEAAQAIEADCDAMYAWEAALIVRGLAAASAESVQETPTPPPGDWAARAWVLPSEPDAEAVRDRDNNLWTRTANRRPWRGLGGVDLSWPELLVRGPLVEADLRPAVPQEERSPDA
jgi:hypothetical protein